DERNASASVLPRSPGPVISGDDIFLTGGTATFERREGGTGLPYTTLFRCLTGGDAGNYYLDAVSTTTANISVLHVTGSFTAQSKTYDGNTRTTVLTRSPGAVISGDDIFLTGGTASFDTRNVGTGKTVTLAGAS